MSQSHSPLPIKRSQASCINKKRKIQEDLQRASLGRVTLNRNQAILGTMGTEPMPWTLAYHGQCPPAGSWAGCPSGLLDGNPLVTHRLLLLVSQGQIVGDKRTAQEYLQCGLPLQGTQMGEAEAAGMCTEQAVEG